MEAVVVPEGCYFVMGDNRIHPWIPGLINKFVEGIRLRARLYLNIPILPG